MRVIKDGEDVSTLTKLFNGDKNIYLFNFELIKKFKRIKKNLGLVSNKQQVTEELIKNNIKSTITENNKFWGYRIVKSTDSNYNYHYSIKCKLREVKYITLPTCSDPHEAIKMKN